ncbi:MAG: DUF2911 domain-containing protein [Bacteroidota bacterium]
MKKLLSAIFIITISYQSVYAQMTAAPSGGNKRASVYEQVGLTDVTVKYSRPHVNGREGKIWGKLVPVGFVDQGFGPSKAAPWRAGANESTTIEFSTDVKINGQPLAAGKYGFFIAYDPNECTLIFSKNNTAWGSFFYNAAEDVLRVKVKPNTSTRNEEWLKYEFNDQTSNSALLELKWEKQVIPMKIESDLVKNQIASYRRELEGEKGFSWEGWEEAAQFCALHKTNLDQALLWADTATSVGFGGSQSFRSWSTKAMVLDSLGRNAEAMVIMKKALPYGNINELYFYARTLAAQKKGKEAFEIFKIDYDKHPNEFITNVGMARGYSAIGDYKKAMPYALKAKAQAPPGQNTATMERIITNLQAGKDVN